MNQTLNWGSAGGWWFPVPPLLLLWFKEEDAAVGKWLFSGESAAGEQPMDEEEVEAVPMFVVIIGEWRTPNEVIGGRDPVV